MHNDYLGQGEITNMQYWITYSYSLLGFSISLRPKLSILNLQRPSLITLKKHPVNCDTINHFPGRSRMSQPCHKSCRFVEDYLVFAVREAIPSAPPAVVTKLPRYLNPLTNSLWLLGEKALQFWRSTLCCEGIKYTQYQRNQINRRSSTYRALLLSRKTLHALHWKPFYPGKIQPHRLFHQIMLSEKHPPWQNWKKTGK